MKKVDMFQSISLENLKVYLSLMDQFESKDEMYIAISNEIQRREEEESKGLNRRFTMKMFKDLSMFYPDEMCVLEVNGIKNLQDLIDCDLNSMIGITESIKEKLDWARKFYDMDPKKTKKQKIK